LYVLYLDSVKLSF